MKALHHCSEKKKDWKTELVHFILFSIHFVNQIYNSSFVFIPNVIQSKFIQTELHTALLYSLFHMIPRFDSFHENCWLDISALESGRRIRVQIRSIQIEQTSKGEGNPKIDLHKPIVTSDTIKENIQLYVYIYMYQ